MVDNYTSSNCSSMSEDVRELMKSMLLAEASFNPIEQSAENAHQKYKYAKLLDISKSVKESLMKNNIKIAHFRTVVDDSKIQLTTRFIHSLSGQWIQDVCIVESEKPGNQAKGAALTYMLKDALRVLCALPTQEDDDGEDEQKYIEAKPKGVPKPFVTSTSSKYASAEISIVQSKPNKNIIADSPEVQIANKYITKEDNEELVKLLQGCKNAGTLFDQIKKEFKVEKLSDLYSIEIDLVKEMIMKGKK